jgi:hypothetical protein
MRTVRVDQVQDRLAIHPTGLGLFQPVAGRRDGLRDALGQTEFRGERLDFRWIGPPMARFAIENFPVMIESQLRVDALAMSMSGNQVPSTCKENCGSSADQEEPLIANFTSHLCLQRGCIRQIPEKCIAKPGVYFFILL